MSHKLNTISPLAPKHLDKEKTKAKTHDMVQKIAAHQKILFAQAKYSLLIILQGIDAAGKDGLIADVFTGLNPLGCNVKAFKTPTPEELSHDFLWRVHSQTPAKGMIHIFNRSHYEDILVPVVNGEVDHTMVKKRIRDINNFESLLEDNGTVVLKFYLHISREEQRQRLLERQTNPKKYWKHNDGDWETRKKWKCYMEAYETIFRECNQPKWTIVPADQNWYKEYIVAKKVLDALDNLKLEYPKLMK